MIRAAEVSMTPAQPGDLLPVLKLFDEAVVWLNQRGITQQWGTEPISLSPQSQAQFMGWIAQGHLFAAHLDGRIVGSLALSPTAPGYIAKRWEQFPASAFYLEAFVTARVLAGQGLGRIMLQWAERYTREVGKAAIWLDCWGENADLVRYYQRVGFEPREEFLVKGWRGQLFEKVLSDKELPM